MYEAEACKNLKILVTTTIHESLLLIVRIRWETGKFFVFWIGHSDSSASSNMAAVVFSKTTMPARNFYFGGSFLLKIAIGESFLPDAVHERTIVKLLFSCPVVLSFTDDSPFLLTMRDISMSKGDGTSTESGPVKSDEILSNIKALKAPSFSSKSAGTCWHRVVFVSILDCFCIWIGIRMHAGHN